MSESTTSHAVLDQDLRRAQDQPSAATDVLGTTWSPEVRTALRSYVAQPLFRAATYEELVIDDNPFRRPVRPEDLAWLDFDEPLTAATCACLSSLLGHRMLRNVLDAAQPGSLSPRSWTMETRSDADHFYSVDNRAAGARIRPFLEQHLYGFLEGSPPVAAPVSGPVSTTVSAPAGMNSEEHALSIACTATARDCAGLLAEQGEKSARMMVVQLLAPALVARAAGSPSPGLTATAERVVRLAQRLGLATTAHSYWQYYLPTTLALANQLDRDPDASPAWRAGVLSAVVIDAQAWLAVLGDEADEVAANEVGAQTEPGAAADPEYLRGLRETAALLTVVGTDRTRQLELIGGGEVNRLKAKRLYDGIQRDQVPVDLDTFVESWEECSTTHVHDDDRLVVVESGEMVFWTCLGQEIRLQEGEMTFVPVHRLHGSVVLSGTCTYHQPVITDDLARRYC